MSDPLADLLREAEDADAAEGHNPTCHEPWEYRIAARLRSAGATLDAAAPAAEKSDNERLLEEAESELEDWRRGTRSWWNLGPYPPYTPDVIAAMDAQEVVKLCAYITAKRAAIAFDAAVSEQQ